MADKQPEKKTAKAAAKDPKAQGKGAKVEVRKAAPKAEGGAQVKPAQVRLKEKYEKEIIPLLREKLQLRNPYAVPRLVKIAVNTGFGKAATENNPKMAEVCVQDMGLISGQKPVVTIARKSVSNFKLREGMQVGCRVTLRGVKMWEFLDRLFNVALPRVRDFRGLSPRSFDGRGNYSMGLAEQTVFPEIEVDKVDVLHGMDITICTTAKKDEHARELLKALGAPFRAN